MTTVCHCDDCQRGARLIEMLPGAAPVAERDGGTAYVLYRRDRFTCTKGAEWLRDMRLQAESPTKRVVAGCCNSAMYADFEKGHWISAYRRRVQGAAPPIQMHIQTRFRPKPGPLATDPPSYRTFPPSFLFKLLFTRVAMFFS
ncbi:hypothetical protein [Pararobbsia alpina]|uniref:hypothetical protein n=1 Tax=Pararobbsia alpina TaxID=621374 RepID=UPI0039A678E2